MLETVRLRKQLADICHAFPTFRFIAELRATAKEFLAASNFFEIMSLFGPLETDVSLHFQHSL
jgi:hypothetical protein